MACATADRQRGPNGKVAIFPAGFDGLGPVRGEKQDHHNESREQLLAELEEIEKHLTTQTDELRQTTLQLASAEQRERDRLARILHDDLQQLLLAAKWNLQCLKEQLRSDRIRTNELSHAIRMVARSIEMSRSLSQELSPPGLDSGLLPAIEHLAGHFSEAYGFHVLISVRGRFSAIPDSLRDFLFAAIRELLINASKHSNQNEAQLRLKKSKSVIEVVVSDEGVGFDPSELDRILAKGSGLLRVWTRTRRIGGQLQVETSRGTGARFRLSVPCFPTK